MAESHYYSNNRQNRHSNGVRFKNHFERQYNSEQSRRFLSCVEQFSANVETLDQTFKLAGHLDNAGNEPKQILIDLERNLRHNTRLQKSDLHKLFENVKTIQRLYNECRDAFYHWRALDALLNAVQIAKSRHPDYDAVKLVTDKRQLERLAFLKEFQTAIPLNESETVTDERIQKITEAQRLLREAGVDISNTPLSATSGTALNSNCNAPYYDLTVDNTDTHQSKPYRYHRNHRDDEPPPLAHVSSSSASASRYHNHNHNHNRNIDHNHNRSHGYNHNHNHNHSDSDRHEKMLKKRRSLHVKDFPRWWTPKEISCIFERVGEIEQCYITQRGWNAVIHYCKSADAHNALQYFSDNTPMGCKRRLRISFAEQCRDGDISSGNTVCWEWNERQCSVNNCPRLHVCKWCGSNFHPRQKCSECESAFTKPPPFIATNKYHSNDASETRMSARVSGHKRKWNEIDSNHKTDTFIGVIVTDIPLSTSERDISSALFPNCGEIDTIKMERYREPGKKTQKMRAFVEFHAISSVEDALKKHGTLFSGDSITVQPSKGYHTALKHQKNAPFELSAKRTKLHHNAFPSQSLSASELDNGTMPSSAHSGHRTKVFSASSSDLFSSVSPGAQPSKSKSKSKSKSGRHKRNRSLSVHSDAASAQSTCSSSDAASALTSPNDKNNRRLSGSVFKSAAGKLVQQRRYRLKDICPKFNCSDGCYAQDCELIHVCRLCESEMHSLTKCHHRQSKVGRKLLDKLSRHNDTDSNAATDATETATEGTDNVGIAHNSSDDGTAVPTLDGVSLRVAMPMSTDDTGMKAKESASVSSESSVSDSKAETQSLSPKTRPKSKRRRHKRQTLRKMPLPTTDPIATDVTKSDVGTMSAMNDSLRSGMCIFVLDAGVWRRAKIVKSALNESEPKIIVHFLGWDPRWDTTLSMNNESDTSKISTAMPPNFKSEATIDNHLFSTILSPLIVNTLSIDDLKTYLNQCRLKSDGVIEILTERLQNAIDEYTMTHPKKDESTPAVAVAVAATVAEEDDDIEEGQLTDCESTPIGRNQKNATICGKWNTDMSCRNKKCKERHVCKSCGSDLHIVLDCPNLYY